MPNPAVSFPINNSLAKTLQNHSLLTGISVHDIVEGALTDWLETIGAARLETLRLRDAKNSTTQ